MAIDSPGRFLAPDWLPFLQVGVGVQCLAEGGPGACCRLVALYSLLHPSPLHHDSPSDSVNNGVRIASTRVKAGYLAVSRQSTA